MPTECAARPDRFVVVYNPVAGKQRAGAVADAIRAGIQRAGRRCDLTATEADTNAGQVAKAQLAAIADGERLCIVACGGDGTVQQVAHALAVTSKPAVLGLAPCGRCNDFARALGIDGSPDRIVDVLLSGQRKRLDLGRIGDRYYCTIAAVGFDAAVSRFVNEMRAPLSGPSAYVYGTLRVLMRYRTPILRVRYDDDEYVGPVFLVAAANTPWYGGALRIAPEADPTDGLLDVCMVTAITRRRVLRLLPKVMSGSHVCLPEVRMFRTRRLEIEAASGGDDAEVWADGEAIRSLPVSLESVPGAIDVLVP